MHTTWRSGSKDSHQSRFLLARSGREWNPAALDVIVGGALILSEVMSAFERRTCLVSEADILDGMVAGLR